MVPTLLRLGAVRDKNGLPACTPYLMPFHIDYSGKAPISTYLRVEAASEVIGAAPNQEDASSTDLKAGGSSELSQNSTDAIVDAESLSEARGKDGPPLPPPRLAKRVTNATTRFISSFRGRTIQGLKVELPEGYGGLVLRGDVMGSGTKADNPRTNVNRKTQGKQKAKKSSKGRMTRSTAHIETDGDDNAMEVDGDEVNLKDQISPGETARTLIPSSQFSSFILWHPDNPVDETRDEYFRSLKEWTQLAHEVCCLFLFFFAAYSTSLDRFTKWSPERRPCSCIYSGLCSLQ